MSGPKHSCGVVGFALNTNIAPFIYRALRVIQHRGQESAGVSFYDGEGIQTVKGSGLVHEVLDAERLASIEGKSGIGHVRYSTAGSKGDLNSQPMSVATLHGQMALAHNGDITNADELRRSYLQKGWAFLTDSDSEIILRLLSRDSSSYHDPIRAIKNVMSIIDGAYSLTILIGDRVFGVRDPYGFHPLCVGRLSEGYFLASESAVVDILQGEFVCDVGPGEIVEITPDSVKIYPTHKLGNTAHCMFEWVYFARPDSVLDGRETYQVRRNIGKILAKECPVDADVVIPVPDSGRAHGLGFAEESGISYEEGFMKNRHVERTFILPDQKQREAGVSLKLNPIRSTIQGRRVVVVDDSIVRGTTLRKLVQMLRKAGAKEVHVRIGCPPIISPCYYGVDMKSRDQFVATNRSVDEIADLITADSLGYISIKGLVEALGFSEQDLCLACVTGRYPTVIAGESHRFQRRLDSDF
ncbi:MAG: amidophosphoribosyltransferase [Candidatus Methanomethylophilaceae archaeon]|nr:amidophosphoribosyltransferase [Candidatus Methanomethylophilaceae archaeon]